MTRLPLQDEKKDEGQEKKAAAMEVSTSTSTSTSLSTSSTSATAGKDERHEAAAVEEEKEPEPLSELLNNPARVMKNQLRVLSPSDGCKYTPVKEVSCVSKRVGWKCGA